MKQLSSLKCLIKNYKINGFQIYIYKPSQKLMEKLVHDGHKYANIEE